MAFTEISYEEIKGESDYDSESVSNEGENQSLNPQINRGFQESKKVVYYKNPWVQTLTVLAFGTPLIWMLLSAFSPAKPPEETSTQVPLDEEKVRMQQALEEEREINKELQIKNALQEQENQKIEVVVPPAEPEPEPEVAAPPPSQPVATAVVERPPPARPEPKPEPERIVEQIEEEPVDPMAQWLTVANRGHYVSSAPAIHREENLVASNSSHVENTTKTPAASPPPPEYLPQKLSTPKPILLSNAQVKNRLDSTSLYNTDELKQRLNRPLASNTSNNNVGYSQARVVSPPPFKSGERMTSDSQQFLALPKNNVTNNIASQNIAAQTLDIGSSAEATLNSSVVWTGNFENSNDKYLLTLKEGFENVEGEEILPEGTRLIAQVREFDSSGLLFMEVTQIIVGTEKIAVPQGSMRLEGKNGSPLKADLKRKGDSNFLTDLGAIVAPGVEKAMDSVADSADSFTFNGGDNSFSSYSNRDRNPLASGVSGVAEGAGNVLNDRLQRNARNGNILSYFQLESGTTVHLVVYNDFSW